METTMLSKFIVSAISLALIIASYFFLKSKARKLKEQNEASRNKYFIIKRLIKTISTIIFILILVLIWGIDMRNLWISITGIMAMIAVAFVAVWSLIANILAGVIIFFTTPFKINDHIEILPDQIKGRVVAINTFFTLISDAEGNLISVPNSLFFQKFIKKIKR